MRGERCASQACRPSGGSLERMQGLGLLHSDAAADDVVLRKRVMDFTKRFATTMGVDIVLEL